MGLAERENGGRGEGCSPLPQRFADGMLEHVSQRPRTSRTDKAEGKKPHKACTDAALRDLIRDKAKGKKMWYSSGQAVFGDYNRTVNVYWTVVI